MERASQRPSECSAVCFPPPLERCVSLASITLLDPLRYFLIILRGSFLEGGSASLFWPQYWPLALIGIVSMIVASRLFRSRLS